MEEPKKEEVIESMRDLMEKTLPYYTDIMSTTLTSYLKAMRAVDEDEDLEILNNLYDTAAEHYLKMLKEARETLIGKPLLPIIVAHTYLLCYMHSEMSTLKEWADFSEAVMDVKSAVENWMKEEDPKHDPAYR